MLHREDNKPNILKIDIFLKFYSNGGAMWSRRGSSSTPAAFVPLSLSTSRKQMAVIHASILWFLYNIIVADVEYVLPYGNLDGKMCLQW